MLCVCAEQTAAGAGADPAGHSLAAAGSGSERSIRAIPAPGKLLLTGAEGVPRDAVAAIKLLKDSAAQGNQFAQYTLGKLYLLGQEVQADREEALRYLVQAAAQGNTYAQYFIDHQKDFSGAAAGTSILRMLHQMSRIFRENAAQPAIYAEMQIDKKRRRRLQEKRMAMGHKADDHEDRGLTQQTQ